MAEVDFSHAKIAPAALSGFVNPTQLSYVSLPYYIRDASGTNISPTVSFTKLVDAQKQVVYQYNGTFTASGTEFYILPSGTPFSGWRVYNISFSSGDTFIFQIQADLICQ